MSGVLHIADLTISQQPLDNCKVKTSVTFSFLALTSPVLESSKNIDLSIVQCVMTAEKKMYVNIIFINECLLKF